MTALQPLLDADVNGSLTSPSALRPDEWLDLAYEHGTPESSELSPHDSQEPWPPRSDNSTPLPRWLHTYGRTGDWAANLNVSRVNEVGGSTRPWPPPRPRVTAMNCGFRSRGCTSDHVRTAAHAERTTCIASSGETVRRVCPANSSCHCLPVGAAENMWS